MATLSELLNKVATCGGKIVSTSELSEMEIATAKACNNMFVDENALGYVWVWKEADTSANGLHLQNVSGSFCTECGEELDPRDNSGKCLKHWEKPF